jgi:hypothetical protein
MGCLPSWISDRQDASKDSYVNSAIKIVIGMGMLKKSKSTSMDRIRGSFVEE